MNNLTEMLKLFGKAGEKISCETAMNAGKAFALALKKAYGHIPKVFVSKDTRISSDALAAAVTAGLLNCGADVVDLSVVPVTAAAYLAVKYGIDAIVYIMSEHTDVHFSEIQFLNRYGFEPEQKITDLISTFYSDVLLGTCSTEHQFGRLAYHKMPCEEYIRYLSTKISGSCDGVRLYIDCASGTTAYTAKAFFTLMGTECIMANDTPNGVNLYENSGFIFPQILCESTKKHRCHAGIAFDNTGKKFIMSDENGTIIEIDKIVLAIATALKKCQELNDNKLGITRVANRSVVTYARSNGIQVREATDYQGLISYIYANNIGLATNSKDEIIFKDIVSVPDAQLAAAVLACALATTDKKLSKLLAGFDHYPQVIIKVKADEEQKGKFITDTEISYWVYQANKQLENEGIIKAYPLNTEPFIAVFAEGKNFEQINTIITTLGKKIAGRLNSISEQQTVTDIKN